MKQLKENYNNTLEKYIIKSFPIVQAYEGIEKYMEILFQFGYLVVFDNSSYVGIITPHDLIKKHHKLAVDCLTSRKIVNYYSTINDVFEIIKEQNTYLLPVFKDEQFFGIIIFIHLIDQLFADTDALKKRIDGNEREIESFKEKNKIVDQIKKEFVNNVSHEFRTPINAIVGFSKIVTSKDIQDEKRNQYLAIIQSSGYRLLKLVDDLMELAIVKSGDISLKYKICPIKELFGDIINENIERLTQLGKKQIEIDYYIEDSVKEYFFTTDELRLKQIFAFLIDNAAKFSQNNKIFIGCLVREFNKIEFFIRDIGPGIPSDKIDSVQNEFIKLENDPKKMHEGMGVGLAITKKLIELMGGDLKIESTINQGTIVFFSLPVSGK